MPKKAYSPFQIQARVKRLLHEALMTKEFGEMVLAPIGEEFQTGKREIVNASNGEVVDTRVVFPEETAQECFNRAIGAAIMAIEAS